LFTDALLHYPVVPESPVRVYVLDPWLHHTIPGDAT